MKRREFITLFGVAAATWPLAARAQQPAMPVIGFLHVGSPDALSHLVTAFRQGLKEVGYFEGQNVAIEFRWAEGHYDRLPALAADLVRRQVAVIITGGGDAPAAILSRPGGNITGVNILTTELAAKRLGLLNDLVPAGSVIAYIVNPNFPATESNVKEVETAARAIGRQILLLKATNEKDIDAAFVAISEMRSRALLVGSDPFFTSRRDQFVALAARYAVPTIYEQREFAVAGGLMSYGTSLTDSYRQMGNYVGRILKGEKPADLPVVQSVKFELVINLKTAKALGLTLPSGLLSIADEVIE
jgi:putative tryptophan/tyrosine transport system substrate-binding protein